MVNLYYIFALFAITWELKVLKEGESLYVKALETMRIKVVHDLRPRQLFYLYLKYLYLIWVTVGLFSSQWFLFLPFWATFLKTGLLPFEWRKRSIFRLCIIAIILVNKFFIKIDISGIYSLFLQ